MSEIDDGKMSFFDHLTELRTRIVWSLIPSAVGLGVALYFTTPMMKFIQRPADEDGHEARVHARPPRPSGRT